MNTELNNKICLVVADGKRLQGLVLTTEEDENGWLSHQVRFDSNNEVKLVPNYKILVYDCMQVSD